MQTQSKPFMGFAKNVFILGSRHYQRNLARKELSEHITKARSKAERKKRISTKEIANIEEKVSNLLEREKKFICFNAVEQKQLMDLITEKHKLASEVERLKKENQSIAQSKRMEVESLWNSLNSLKSRINALTDKRQEEEKRRVKQRGELERRINSVNEKGFFASLLFSLYCSL